MNGVTANLITLEACDTCVILLAYHKINLWKLY